MITTPTVFILGAGASKPFGFPSGVELAEQLSDFGDFQDLIAAGFDQSHIVDFREQLKRSGKGSVDAFLEYRDEFIAVGKAAIAYRLIQLENANELLRFKNNWYRYIFGKLDAPLSEFHKNDVTFVTFNYDRSLDHFLFDCLKHSYKGTDDEVAKALSHVPIIHVHGQMGLLPWQEDRFGIKSRRDYGTAMSPEAVRAAADGIRIVHEVKDLAPFDLAFQRLARAERIVFLGFGYYGKNLDRLRFKDVLSLGKDGKVFGTFYEMTNAQIGHVRKEFFNNTITPGGNGEDVLTFLMSNGNWQG